jgi:two-component system, NtrC family, sensor kinase
LTLETSRLGVGIDDRSLFRLLSSAVRFLRCLLRFAVPPKAASGFVNLDGLLIGVILPPMLLFAVVAWLDRVSVLDQATQQIGITTRVLGENAHNVFDTHRLVAKLVNERIHAMSWDEISRSEGLHQYLVAVVGDFPKMQSVSLVDRWGMVRCSSAIFPVPTIDLADQDYFVGLRERDVGLFVGQPVHGRVFTADVFNVAQRRSSDSGQFDGIIVVSALPSYFVNFWKAVSGTDGATEFLARRDGTLLAHNPPVGVDTPRLAANSPLMQAIAAGDAGVYQATSGIDGQDRIVAYERIEGLTLYVGHGLTTSVILGIWHRHLFNYIAFFGIATLGLTSLAVLAYQRAAGEVAALRHWRQTAEKLTEEAEQRAVVQAQLRQAQKMETFGQLTGGIAHDFNNLLQVISGSMDVLKGRAAFADQALVGLVLESVQRCRKMIESMLAFARQQPLKSEVFDLNETVPGMQSLLHPALGSHVALKIVASATPCLVRADRNRAELAILNLALNARDAMADGGTLTLTVSVRHLAGAPAGLRGEYGSVAVQDTGVGMSAEVQARAFEPFFTTKGLGKGTGLGLSMVYGFAEQSHGTVTIDSAPGRGTTIVLYLPSGDA